MCPRNVDICLFPGLAALIRQNCKPHRVDPMNLQAWVSFFQRPWLASRQGIRWLTQKNFRVERFFLDTWGKFSISQVVKVSY